MNGDIKERFVNGCYTSQFARDTPSSWWLSLEQPLPLSHCPSLYNKLQDQLFKKAVKLWLGFDDRGVF